MTNHYVIIFDYVRDNSPFAHTVVILVRSRSLRLIYGDFESCYKIFYNIWTIFAASVHCENFVSKFVRQCTNPTLYC